MGKSNGIVIFMQKEKKTPALSDSGIRFNFKTFVKEKWLQVILLHLCHLCYINNYLVARATVTGAPCAARSKA